MSKQNLETDRNVGPREAILLKSFEGVLRTPQVAAFPAHRLRPLESQPGTKQLSDHVLARGT